MRCSIWKLLGFLSTMLLTAAPTHADVRIGLAAPLTGDLAWYGAQGERTVKLAVTDLNAAGGVLEEAVRLVAVDDYCDPEQAIAAAHKLIGAGVSVVMDIPAPAPRSRRPPSITKRGC